MADLPLPAEMHHREVHDQPCDQQESGHPLKYPACDAFHRTTPAIGRAPRTNNRAPTTKATQQSGFWSLVEMPMSIRVSLKPLNPWPITSPRSPASRNLTTGVLIVFMSAS